MIFFTSISISQINQLDFVEKKNKTKDEQGDNIRVVYFDLKNIDSDKKSNEISSVLLNDNKIHKFSIKDNKKCYAVIDKDVNPQYIRKLINPLNVDFDFRTIIVNDLRAITDDLPDDYPLNIDNIYDKGYIQRCIDWRNTNPDKWQKAIDKANNN